MYSFVNASPPKLLEVATSNVLLNRLHNVEGTGQLFV